MPVVPNRPVPQAPLVDIPTGGTLLGEARNYSLNIGVPNQVGVFGEGAFKRSAAFWDPITDGFADAAKAGKEIIQATLKEQAETEGLDAYTAAARKLNDFVNNDISNRKGQNAFGSVDDVTAFSGKVEELHSKPLSSEAARKIFSERFADLRFGLQNKVSTYEGGERRQARFNAIESAAATEKDLAMNNFGNDRLFTEGKTRGLQYAAEIAAMNGWDEKTTALYLQKAAGEFDTGRVERFAAAGEYDRAFDEWKNSGMSADAKFKAGQALGKKYLEDMTLEAHQNPFHMREQLRRRRSGSAADFAAQRESGDNPGAIGYDGTGGTSYGAWQISSANMPAFIKHLEAKRPDFAEQLRTAGPANTGGKGGDMVAAWKKIAAEAPEEFKDIQRDFIQKTHIDPVLQHVAPEAREALESNPTLARALWSTAVQHGAERAPVMIASAWEKSGGDSAQFIKLLYADRKTRFGKSTSEVRGAVAKRLDEEEAELLGESSAGGTPSSPDRRHDPQSVDDLVGPAGLYRVEKAADTELKQQAAILLHGADDAFSYGRKTGDFSQVENLERRLTDLGQGEAALEVRQSRILYQQAEPFMRSSPNEPLLARAQNAQNAIEALRTPENSATVDKVLGAVMGDINQEQARFKHDPAGYVAGNPALQDESLTPEARIKTSLELQRQAGAGLKVTPQVLTAAQSAELRQRYEGTTDYGEKAKLGLALYQAYGRYAGAAAAEAGMPAALISIAQVAPRMTPGDVTKLLIAAEANDKDLPPLSEEERKNRDAAVANSSFLKTLMTMRSTMYASEGQAQFYADMAKTLTNYSRMGYNLKDFESQFLIVNDGDMAIIAPRGTPFDEDALQNKKAELVYSMALAGETLDRADGTSAKRLPASAVGGAMGAIGFLAHMSTPNEGRHFVENYRSMYDNGVWMYDPQEEGYVLWDKLSGRAAPDMDGFPIIVRTAHLNSLKVKMPNPTSLGLHGGYR